MDSNKVHNNHNHILKLIKRTFYFNNFNPIYLFLNVLVSHRSERVYTPQINKMSFKLPSFPLLPQRDMIRPSMSCDHLKKDCSKEFCECTNIIKVPLGSIVELFLIDKG